jgi:hypothetical protein
VAETDDPRAAAERMAEAANQLAHSTKTIAVPSDSPAILGSILDAQRSLEQALSQLAEWHRLAGPGVHYPEHHEESGLGVMTAVAELDLAAQQAGGLVETVSRAHGGNKVVQWFDVPERDAD